MRSQLTASLVIAIISMLTARFADAQVFTPTEVPQNRIFRTPADLRPLDLKTTSLNCGLADTLKPERVLEAVHGAASGMRRVFDNANQRLAKAERVDVGIHRRDLDERHDELKEAIVDLSVASSAPKWEAAIVRGITAARQLGQLVIAKPTLNSDETDSFNRSQSAARCSADWLAKKAASGPPSDLGLMSKTAWILPGAGFATGEQANDINLKAAEFFFSGRWRLYVHSTVTVEKNEPEVESSARATEATEPDADEVAESVKSALLNPYGSPLYLTAGYLRKIRTPFFDGDANDAHHGLFFDSRFGFKFMPLPEESLKLIEGQTRNTAFYIGSAALRLRLPLYREVPFVAGDDGIDIALTGAINQISNSSVSKLFQVAEDGAKPLIPKTLYAAHLAVGISLPKLANVVISGTLWSNSKFDRRFQIAVNLQKADTEVAANGGEVSAPATDAATGNGK